MSANCNPPEPNGTYLTSRPISSQHWGKNPVTVSELHRSKCRDGKPSTCSSEFFTDGLNDSSLSVMCLLFIYLIFFFFFFFCVHTHWQHGHKRQLSSAQCAHHNKLGGFKSGLKREREKKNRNHHFAAARLLLLLLRSNSGSSKRQLTATLNARVCQDSDVRWLGENRETRRRRQSAAARYRQNQRNMS